MGGQSKIERQRRTYLVLSLLVSASVLWGFLQTYLTPDLFAGALESLPLSVHIHGISFLAWYALLVVQACLVVFGSIRFHRALGLVTACLVPLMVLSGLQVIAVRMEGGLAGESPFWGAFGLMILSNLILFAGFFVAAIRQRKRPDQHRRLILLAAATGSGAAQFRTLMVLLGPMPMVAPAGILVTNLFIVLAMIGEKWAQGSVPRLYWIALPLIMLFELLMLWLAGTSFGLALQQGLVDLVRVFYTG